ncbi:two-component system sensor histidine kinase YesM [Paenibacillus rhizosphaerae]|uniref:Two-component system sensor histidine kinase YesM n=1 Tax=Paenibacillus rhizosphaerae TaxID=297318 RepID=A0A839U267_9BACL|nr:histidine kinase [Paenibacillus rhizosphaerae]MBB3130977.1 two-component system sensor histidine kinase YesM [Paenibacillus rhizosphaerae]
MLHWIKSRFNDIRFRNKLLLSHLFIALIPILLLGVLAFIQSYRIQMKELKSEAAASLDQVANILDYKINRYNTLSEFIVLNRDFSKLFTRNYGGNYFEMFLDFRDIMDPLISNTKTMDDNIEGITFYTSGDLLGIRDNILPLSDLKQKPWFEGYRGRHWVVDGSHVYLVQELISNLKDSNYMVISVNYDSIFSDMDKLSDHITVQIEGPQHQPIFREQMAEAPAQGATRLDRTLKSNGWTIHYYLSNANAYVNALTFFKITLLVIALSLLVAFFLIYIVSNNFTRRIIHLKNKVDKVEQNNLDVVIQSSSRDEFGELTNGIGKMLGRINSLIHQVYQAEIARQQSEYQRLINQINPHFLYNTLSFIHWRAKKKRDLETGYMVSTLAKFYRTTLNGGRDMATVSNEIEHIRAYLDLQLVMNDGDFDVEFQVEEDTADLKIIHFVLQPIVENAIKHGFTHPEAEETPRLVIASHRQEGILTLSVTDNGVGMTPVQAAKLLSAENGGTGVKNVNDRMKLYYGQPYGLAIDSVPGIGTTVTLTFPAEPGDTAPKGVVESAAAVP